MFKLFHKELNGVNGSGSGIIILESEPQLRTTLLARREQTILRLPYPYMLFSITYYKRDGLYYYGGLFYSGLRIFFNTKPLSSFDDPIYCPIDHACRNGLICTSHQFDQKRGRNSTIPGHKSIRELVDFVLNVWWGTIQDYNFETSIHDATISRMNAETWSKIKLEDINKYIDKITDSFRITASVRSAVEFCDTLPFKKAYEFSHTNTCTGFTSSYSDNDGNFPLPLNMVVKKELWVSNDKKS